MTYDDIKKANQQLETVPVKGKDYVQVNERVKAFRSVCPGGVIETEMVYYEGGRVMFKATVKDQDDRILATGYAEEKEGSTMINKTSFIENCETSAVGRALGFAGIGIDGSMASAEEVATAIVNQNKPAPRPAAPSYPPEFMAACKVKPYPASNMTLGKLYKEDRKAFNEVIQQAMDNHQGELLAACQTIVYYMEVKQ